MMKILYTSSNTPYIKFDDNNRIAFSSLTATDEGYSHLIVSGMGKARFSKAKGSKKKVTENLQSKERISVISDIKFTGTGVVNKLKLMYMYKYIPTIKKHMEGLIKEGIFPKKNITKLGKILEGINESTIIVEEPKKVSKRKTAKVKTKRKKR